MSLRRDKASLPLWARIELTRYRRHVAVALVLGIAAFGCGVLLMFTAGYLISRTAQSGTTLFMVMVPIALVQIFGLGRPAARYFERLVSHDWVFRITSDLRLALFRAIEKRTGNPSSRRSTGDYLDMLSDDIGHLQNLYLRVAFPVAITWLLFVAVSILSALIAWQLALVLLALGLIAAVLLPFAALAITRSLTIDAKNHRARSYEALTDDIKGAVDWSLAGRASEAANAHSKTGHTMRRIDGLIARRLRIVELVSALALALGGCIVITVSALNFSGDTAQANYIAAFALGYFPLVETCMLLPLACVDSTSHRESIAHLDEVLDAPPASYALALSPDKSVEQPSSFEIEFNAVSYRYPHSTRLALDDISLSIPEGQKVAVLGRSGAGKSTFASLLQGTLAPDKGTAAIGGCLIGQLAEPSAYVCRIPQVPFIFDDSLRENLLLANAGANDEELVEALKRVGLAGKLAGLPQGLNEHVGETGVGFSGGEAHRIALARALLSHAPIIVLDEPFTALDTETERDLLDTLFSVFDGKTLIVVTHHLAGICQFDRVVFIEDCHVEMDGSPRALAQDDPRFQELLRFDRGFTSPRPPEPLPCG